MENEPFLHGLLRIFELYPIQFHKGFGHNCDLLTHCSMKQMEKNMPIKIILARSCIFLGLDFYASISWGARAEEICRTIWVKAKISNSGSFKSIKTIVRSCKCNLKLFKVRPSNACERKSIWARPIEGKCYQQKCFFFLKMTSSKKSNIWISETL